MNDQGFPELYEHEFGAVFRAAFLACGDRAAAEDATQEAFARALARWRRLAGQPWVAGWVMTTAMNIARRAMRRPSALEEELSRGLVDQDAQLDVRFAIGRLPARQLEAVALHYLLDLSVRDTAEAMGISDGTVKMHLARARQALGEAIGRAEGAEGSDEHPAERSGDPHPMALCTRRANDG